MRYSLVCTAITSMLIISMVPQGMYILDDLSITGPAAADPINTTVYHSWDEMVAEMYQIAMDHPHITKLVSIGKTWEGRDILAMKVSDNPDAEEDEPEILYSAMHHAREWLTIEVSLYILNYLTDGYESNATITDIVNNRQIWVIPCVNPDGRVYDSPGDDPTNHSYQTDGWRKNRRDNGDGSFGVDLNRNYDYMWGGAGANNDPSGITYRGPEPFSEPETRAVRDFVIQHDFVFAISYHTCSQLILYPWGYTYNASEDDIFFDTVANKMADLITNKAGSAYPGYTPRQGSDLYTTSGGAVDWLYGEAGVYPFTFELYPDQRDSYLKDDPAVTPPFDVFHPRADKVQPVCEDNIEAALYLAKIADNPFQILDYHVTLSGEEVSLTINQSEAAVQVITAYNDGAKYDTYDLATSSIPGWSIFLNQTTVWADSGDSETVNLILAVPGAQPGGQYLIWVNASSQNSTASNDSLLVRVTVPYYNDVGIESTLPFLRGHIYPMGQYSMNATVVNYGRNSQLGFNVSMEIVKLGAPVEKTVFSDDMENGTNGWDVIDMDATTSPDSWKQVTTASNSPSTSWWCGDSTLYTNKTAQLLVSPSFSLEKAWGANLTFYHKYNIEAGYDFGSVDVFDGSSWFTVASYEGDLSTFSQVKLDLADFIGYRDVKVRFRFTSDKYVIDDGWFIDDLEVVAQFPTETTFFGPSVNQTQGTMAQDDEQLLGWVYTFSQTGYYRIYTTTLLDPDEFGDNNQTYVDIKMVPDNLEVMIPVVTGWNLVSTPLLPDNTSVPGPFTDMDGDTFWSIIQYYDGGDGADQWKSWAQNKPATLNDLTSVDNRMGVWIYIPDAPALGDGYIKLNGTVPASATIDIYKGWDLVGYPSMNPKKRDTALNNLVFGTDVDAIWTFDAATQEWSEMRSIDFFEPGMAYWVHAPSDTTWDVLP